MKKSSKHFLFSQKENIEKIQHELKRRKKLLISFAENHHSPIYETDREHIIDFLLKNESHPRPKTEYDLLKVYLNSCYSYSILNKYIKSHINEIPTKTNLPIALSKIFNEPKFLDDNYWFTTKIGDIAKIIQQNSNYNLRSKEPKPRIISVMIFAPLRLNEEIKNGLDNFYTKIHNISEQGAISMWEYINYFQKPIHHVGATLICDFLKNIGFTRFVKIDHHFQREFPNLINLDSCQKLSTKEHFILSQELADKIGMSPFHLDHLIYQWGRYKKFINEIVPL